jgi:hypothetical protein
MKQPPEAIAKREQVFWRSFLRSLVERGRGGVEVCVSDARESEAAIVQVLASSLVTRVGAFDAECGEVPALSLSISARERAVPGASRGLARSFHRG